MKKPSSFVPVAVVFAALAIVVSVLSVALPNFFSFSIPGDASVRRVIASFPALVSGSLEDDEKAVLREENAALRQKIVNDNSLKKEVEALRSQFEKPEIVDRKELLPARVVAMPGFVPAVSAPQFLVVDKGSSAGVKQGDPVTYENSVLGKIQNSGRSQSRVSLILQDSLSFAAKISASTAAREADGVIKTMGGELFMDNILTSQTVKKGDTVVTKGDSHFPAGLIVGKVASVDKKASELFQRAKIESLIDVSSVEYVFIITQE